MKYSVSINLCRKIVDYKGDLCCFSFLVTFIVSVGLFLCPYSPRLVGGIECLCCPYMPTFISPS